MITREPVPDLLLRFVPLRYKLLAAGTSLESNDPELLEWLDEHTGFRWLAEIAPEMRLRIVREAVVTPGGRERNVCTSEVCTLHAADGSVYMLDRERKNLFAFLSTHLTAASFFEQSLPEVLQHSTHAHHSHSGFARL